LHSLCVLGTAALMRLNPVRATLRAAGTAYGHNGFRILRCSFGARRRCLRRFFALPSGDGFGAGLLV